MVYVILCGVWLLVPMPFFLVWWVVLEETAGLQFSVVTLGVLTSSCLILIASLVMLMKEFHNRPRYRCDKPDDAPRDVLPDHVYMLPFICLKGWLMVPYIVILTGLFP